MSKPFIVVDGVTYLSEAFIADASIKMAEIKSQFLVDPAKYSIKLESGQDGRLFCASVGLGLSFDGCFRPDIVVKAESIEILPDGMVRIKQQQS